MFSTPPASDDVGLAGHDGHGGVVDGLQTRAALPHDRVGRYLDGHARLQHRYASQVGGIGALLGLAEDDLVHRFRFHLRLL